MSRSRKTTLARSSRKKLAELEKTNYEYRKSTTGFIHPETGPDVRRTYDDVEKGGVRYGNNRKYHAAMKVKNRRSKRQKAKETPDV